MPGSPIANLHFECRVAEALQSENLTLKKAAIIIFKQLMEAQNGKLPTIEGVDWASEKVANGKSGRALNYIISQQAKVDNRISNEEIISYDSDSQMLDPSRTCPNSPGSQQSSPQSTAGELWGSAFDITQQQPEHSHVHRKKRKATNTKFGYPGMPDTSVTGDIIPTAGTPFIDPGLLQPTGSIGSAFTNPPTPPTGCDTLDFMPQSQAQWPNQQQQQPQPRFYDERFLLVQRYSEVMQAQQQARGSGDISCDNPISWVSPGLYQYFPTEDKDFGK
jgi:hypothetical protein